jgi:hypothetical protein
MYETIHTEKAAEFDIVFSVTYEDEQPDWDFESEEDKQNTLDRINNGDLVWFVARVQAFNNGIELGADYLGGCCYDSYNQFVEASDYYADMVENAVSEARSTLAKLTEGLTHDRLIQT